MSIEKAKAAYLSAAHTVLDAHDLQTMRTAILTLVDAQTELTRETVAAHRSRCTCEHCNQ